MADGDELAKYAVKKTGEEDDLARYATKPKVGEKLLGGSEATMSAQPSLGSRLWTVAKREGPVGVGRELGESMTRPLLESEYKVPGIGKRLGDVTRDAQMFANILNEEGGLLTMPEAGESLVNIVRGAPRVAKSLASWLAPAEEATEASKVTTLRPIATPKPAPVPRMEPGTVDLGELGPVTRIPRAEPPAVPSPLRPKTLTSPKIQDRVTMASSGLRPLREGATPEEAKFHELFGPEHQEAGDLAEWETGTREPGLKPIARPTVESVVNEAMGVKPLERTTPLKEQLSPAAKNELSRPFAEATQTAEETDPMKVKYPDPAVRRFVRANGERLVDAVGEDKDLLQKIHDLKNVEVRQAAINADIDLGTKHVGSKVALGGEQISRQELLTQILEKGFKPSDIPELAKPKEVTTE
jgi:hypothetical protein